MLGQQNLSPTMQHTKARHALCALTAPQERCCWLRPRIRGVHLSSKCSGCQQSPLLCRRQWRPFKKGESCHFVCLTSAIQHPCKGRWYFWWQTRADTLNTDLYRWVTLHAAMHASCCTVENTRFQGVRWAGRGVTFCVQRGRLHSAKWLCPGKAGGASGAALVLGRGNASQAAHPPCTLPSQHQGPLSPAGPLWQRSRGARTQANPRDADSHQKGDRACGSGMRPSPQPRLAPPVALSSCHQETLADLIS